MNEEWRDTREGPDAFLVDTRPFRRVVRYSVSPDGQTLTIREVSSAMHGGNAENGILKSVVPVLVFDMVRAESL